MTKNSVATKYTAYSHTTQLFVFSTLIVLIGLIQLAEITSFHMPCMQVKAYMRVNKHAPRISPCGSPRQRATFTCAYHRLTIHVLRTGAATAMLHKFVKMHTLIAYSVVRTTRYVGFYNVLFT